MPKYDVEFQYTIRGVVHDLEARDEIDAEMLVRAGREEWGEEALSPYIARTEFYTTGTEVTCD